MQAFHRVHQWIITTAWLHAGPPREFVIDSSAGWTMITPATAAALGLTVNETNPDLSRRVAPAEDAATPPPVRFAALPLLRIAGLTLRDQKVLVLDLPGLQEVCGQAGHEVAGVIGYNILRDTCLTIDYARSTIRLEPAGR